MKKLVLPLLFLALAFSASAQEKTASAEASTFTRTLVNDLELDEATYLKVKEAYTVYFTNREELKQKFSSDKVALSEALKKEEAELDGKLSTVMNSRQFALYTSRKSQN